MIRTDTYDNWSRITIDRPDKRNALDPAHADAIRAAVDERVEAGDRCLVITGVEESFSAGADFSVVGGDGFGTSLHDMLQTVMHAPVPVIAAVNGWAIGAGLQLALACDLRVVAPTAKLGVPTARLGFAVDPWTIARLASVAGAGPAKRMLLTCELIDAPGAAACGLADRVGDAADADELAADIATMAPLTLAYNKRAVNELTMPALDDPALRAMYDGVWASDDRREGLRARNERRPANFQGR